MMYRNLLLALAAITFSQLAAAQAETADRNRTTQRTLVFTEIDADRNDLLDREEVRDADPAADFDEMDQDDDGNVNRNEYFQYHRR